MDKKLLTISNFSKRTGLSRKALLIYDEMGILTPVLRSANNYRKYSESQVEIANEVSMLKGLGFSLEEVKRLFILKGDQDKSILSILRKQKEKIVSNIKNEKLQLENLDKLIEMKSNPFVSGEKRKIVLGAISLQISDLKNDEIKKYTRNISKEDYIMTIAMVDDLAQERILSVLSEKAKNLVQRDLVAFGEKYKRYWS